MDCGNRAVVLAFNLSDRLACLCFAYDSAHAYGITNTDVNFDDVDLLDTFGNFRKCEVDGLRSGWCGRRFRSGGFFNSSCRFRFGGRLRGRNWRCGIAGLVHGNQCHSDADAVTR